MHSRSWPNSPFLIRRAISYGTTDWLIQVAGRRGKAETPLMSGHSFLSQMPFFSIISELIKCDLYNSD